MPRTKRKLAGFNAQRYVTKATSKMRDLIATLCLSHCYLYVMEGVFFGFSTYNYLTNWPDAQTIWWKRLCADSGDCTKIHNEFVSVFASMQEHHK